MQVKKTYEDNIEWIWGGVAKSAFVNPPKA